MFKPGDWILYHMPKGPWSGARPFLVVQAWPNEYGHGKHGYNGLMVLDGGNDATSELNPPGRSCCGRLGNLPLAYCYSVPEGMEEGQVSATPRPEEEFAPIPPHANLTGWGQQAAVPVRKGGDGNG